MFDSDLSARQTAALAPVFLLTTACLVACLIDIWRGPTPRHVPRIVWTIIVLSSSPWGALGYLFFGRGTAKTADDEATVPRIDAPGAGVPDAGTGHARLPQPPTFDVADPALRTRGLVRDYGGAGVLGVDLVLPRRGGYGLVGPNGSGKTTLLALIAGLRRPDRGTVEWGVDRRRVAICPDVPEFEPWLTAREIVDLARVMTARHRPPSASDEVLAEVGLAAVADRRVGGFSRGMAQRLGLAVSLVSDPELIIMDEPTAALDPAGRVELIAVLRSLAERTAVLISSHDLLQVQRATTVVGVMHRGRLVYQGPTADLIRFDPSGHDLEGAFLALTGAHSTSDRMVEQHV